MMGRNWIPSYKCIYLLEYIRRTLKLLTGRTKDKGEKQAKKDKEEKQAKFDAHSF